MDAFTTAALAELRRQAQTWRSVIEGLPDEALDWRPGPETNSLAVLVTHALGTAQTRVGQAAGEAIERDRDAEFQARATSVDLGKLIDAALARLETLIEKVDPDRYGEMQPIPRRGDRLTRAGCLIRAIQHNQEHIGHASLTRQLWEQRAGRSG